MNIQHIKHAAQRAALAAANIQKKYYLSGVHVQHKGDVDLVTQADFESQEAILSVLKSEFPDHRFMAEENNVGEDETFSLPTWVIDPLDGTTNFAHRYPYFGISIALVQGLDVLFALVYQPLLEEMFTAIRGQGAFLNEKKISISTKRELGQSLLSTGFPYDKRTSSNNNLSLFNFFELNSLCVRRGGAAAIDLAYVACGRIDGFWEAKLKPWDLAAGFLLIQEAGGTLSDYAGQPLLGLRGKEVVASNGLIHSDLIRETQKFRVNES